jgi:hypothetical protein
MSRRLVYSVATLFLAACGPGRSEVPVAELVPTGDTILLPYADVAAAAWLGGEGGRWVVVAPQDRAVSVADFGRRSVRPFGSTARRAFEQPYDLFRAGDSIYVSDWQRRQTTVWTLDGRPAGAISAVSGLRGALPRARDGQGRWYFELFPPPGPDGRGNLDSASIVRTSADLTAPDTIARLSPLDVAEVVSEGRRRWERRLLSGQDRWGVLPDGSVWLARVGRNRVDWLGPDGRLATGEELPDRVLPVTQADRDIFLRQFDPGLRPAVEAIPFAAIKPPFEAALTGPDGTVWLVKSRAVGDTIRQYQIVNRAGRLAATVRHRGLGQAVALGGGMALVEEHYRDGVRLLLFRLPG